MITTPNWSPVFEQTDHQQENLEDTQACEL